MNGRAQYFPNWNIGDIREPAVYKQSLNTLAVYTPSCSCRNPEFPFQFIVRNLSDSMDHFPIIPHSLVNSVSSVSAFIPTANNTTPTPHEVTKMQHYNPLKSTVTVNSI